MPNVTKRSQINFAVNEDTIRTIEELKSAFGLESNTAVLRRALAIAKLAASNQRADHTITLLGKDEVRRDVVLNG